MRRFRTRLALLIAPWLHSRVTVTPFYTTSANATHYTVKLQPPQ